MTKKEAVQLLAILKAAYPNSYRGMSKEEATGTVNIWSMQFANMPADIVLMALNKLIASSKFPPSIAEVKDKIGALHWEAYEYKRLQESLGIEPPEQILRVYELTQGYRYGQSVEPSVAQMMTGAQLMLGAAETED